MTADFDFSVEIVRTNRKRSASIQLDGDTVKLTMPRNLSDRWAQNLIQKRFGWIQKQLKIQAESPPPKAKEYVNGEAFLFLGRNYRLKKVAGDSGKVEFRNGYIEVSVPPSLSGDDVGCSVKSSLAQWYAAQALFRLQEKTCRYASIIMVEPKSVRVKSYKSKWGSCAISGDISYNWRIIMAPHHIVDYVVVHELCHLLELNHSPRYWRHVENVISDFRECKEWLKTNGASLHI